MKIWGLFSVILLTTCYASPAESGRAAKLQRVQAFLATQEEIRLAVDMTPGLGNQSNSAELYRYLRRIGYRGTIEVTHPGDLESKRKLRVLFPHGESQRLRFTHKPKKSIYFGLTGGDLPPLNVTHFAIIPPFRWGLDTISVGGDKRFVKSAEGLAAPSGFRPHPKPLALLSRHMRANPALEILSQVVQARRTGAIELITYYSYVGSHSEQLRIIAKALSQADLGTKKPIAIAIFDQPTARTTSQLSSIPGVAVLSPPQPLNLAGESKIALLNIGNVPNPVYRHMLHEATLGNFVGGLNSVNQAMGTGKPFLTTQHPHQTVPASLQLHDRGIAFKETEIITDAEKSLYGKTTDLQGLTRYFEEVHQPDGELNKTFQQAAKFHRTQDKFLEVLYEAVVGIEAREIFERDICP